MNTILEVRKLTIGYNRPIIKDINLEINNQEIAVIIGPNGVGKTTFIKTICGIMPALSGDIVVCNKKLVDIKYKERARLIASVLTERAYADYSCREMISLGRYPYTNGIGSLSTEDKEVIQDAMKLTGIEELADCSIQKISDGQKQRVMLARAICQQPKLLVLDEPTSFLDVKYKIEFLKLLKKLSKEMDFSVIMSLHELDMAKQIADKIICMKTEKGIGIVEKIGTPNEIFRDGYVKKLYGIEVGDFDENTGLGIL